MKNYQSYNDNILNKRSIIQYLSFCCLLFVLSVSALTQNYIGLHKSDIRKKMTKEFDEFSERTVTNKSYNYLKFTDGLKERTILFFLSEKDYCTYVKYMGEFSYLKKMERQLNKKYNKTGKNEWEGTSPKGALSSIKLEKGKWFFTVKYEKK